jgi:hypothetical protein
METRPATFRRLVLRSRSLVGRALTVAAAPALLGVSLTVVSSPVDAQAKVFPGAATIKVEGPLANIESAPLTLTPEFSPNITDYVLRCQSGTNAVRLTLTAAVGRHVNVRGKVQPSVNVQENLVENQALIIFSHGPQNPLGTQYWIRCLPHDFPTLTVSKPGAPPPGWYLTGNVTRSPSSSAYAMILDNNGTPVWYRKPSGSQVLNLTELNDGTIAWEDSAGLGFSIDPAAAYEDYNLVTRATTFLRAPIPPTDFHELHPMANGHLLFLSTPLTSNVDLGNGSRGTIVDCVLQEVDQSGNLVWLWRATDHISVAETAHPLFGVMVNGQLSYDVFHCNSADTEATNQFVLLSSRHTDSVFLINKATGIIVWKVGGNSVSHDHAQILTITGDPQRAFHAQHDARFELGGDISVYDDQSGWPGLAARAVEYHIDTAAGTAHLVWSFSAPDGRNSLATGAFRRLLNGTDNVIAWGFMLDTLFTEVDASGNVMLNVTFPNGEVAYRVIKVAPSALNHMLLRVTAGLPAFGIT